jgi:ABC-type multidrug transport system ATPase subunit
MAHPQVSLDARLESVIEDVSGRTQYSGPAIETSGLTKSYAGLLAVDHLDLKVEQGEIFGFLGPNGAGKTTTMRMLLGLVQPSAGTARVLGMDTKTHLQDMLARIGSVIENPTFYPFLSGYDNLKAFAQLSRIPVDRVAPVLDLVDLTAAAKRKFSTYSLGMKQRLAVGAALLGSPDLLILDEPANGLDPAGIVEMRDLIKRLKSRGRTVLISSHVLHEIEQICDRIAIMNRGRVVVQGPVEELLAGASLEVRAEPLGAAEKILVNLPWVDAVVPGDNRLLVTTGPEHATDITRVLAEQGIYLSRLQPHEQTLEQYFLDVTGDAQ